MNKIRRFSDFARAYITHKRTIDYQWEPDELKRHQQRRLYSLVNFAAQNSSFYKDLYKDIDIHQNLSITELPTINKKQMMNNYDDFVTDRSVKLADLQAHIHEIKGDEFHLNKYRVLTTSGSTGLRGIFVFNRDEWSTAIRTGLRTAHYAGLTSPRLPNRWRMVAIGANSPLHVTGRFYMCVDIGVHNILRLPALTPIRDLVKALNEFKPDYIFGYASILSLLAIEQFEGRLNIRPMAVTTNSEVRTEDMESNIREAWGVTPYDTYGMTESGVVLANDCSHHCGLHVFEDLFIVEAVDERDNPVPDGQSGAKMLMTNLYNFSQPLIRYEITDVIRLSDQRCQCGSAFKLISDIEGRTDDILYLTNEKGARVPVHPHNLRSPIAAIADIKQYQIIHEMDGIHITLALRNDAAATDQLAQTLKDKLSDRLLSLGVICPELHIKFVDELERDQEKMGKLRLIKSNIHIG